MSGKTYLAHLAKDEITGEGKKQTILDHLNGTAKLCAGFAASFGAEKQGLLVGGGHDIGKYSDEFQGRLLGGKIVDHSTAGAYECFKLGHCSAAFCIAGHHGGMPDGGGRGDTSDTPTLCGRLRRVHENKLPEYGAWQQEVKLPVEAPLPAFFGTDAFADSFFTRMLYSCLVDADFLDTEYFIKSGAVERGSYEPISLLMEKLKKYIALWQSPKNELNRRRCEILETCMKSGQLPKGLYTLTVPTGGGKTTASLAFALSHALEHGMSRVIYVIPYTSIIEQNAAKFRDILGNENVVEHHSSSLFDMEEGEETGQYKQALAAENWDAPVIVTTSVQFFESLYSNRPSKCRKLHNIVNSVIIFDEAQMIPVVNLRPCVAAIAQLVKNYNVTAVLCTATQPSLNGLFKEYAPEVAIRELCPDTEEMYRQFRRVSFRIAGKLTEEELCGELSAVRQVLCVVNKRKSARSIYERLPQDGGNFHLSTLMYPIHRRKVLDEIRARLKGGLTCRVVSTSLIEAGVDVDFPSVYREMAGLDSILQAAGRCNREGKKPIEDSVVTIFYNAEEAPLLIKVNIGASNEALKNCLDVDDPNTVERYFKSLLNLSDKKYDEAGVIDAFEKGINGCKMPFRSVAQRFHMINDNMLTVYIPLEEGARLIERLKNGEHSRFLYRQAGQYSVKVCEKHYNELLKAGDIVPLDDDNAILVTLSLYNEKSGLSFEANWGKALFC
ncbi:CRISPR-associated helicase Cas3' [Synergistes jonesii]|uniref:CRISPR-associated helicase Cas3' n=1 Tax=Synergistes jonesii TaxID=2754 RepID=UPI0033286FF5